MTANNALAMKNRDEIAQALAASGYIADGELATAVSLMQLLRRPLPLEGEAGGGQTGVATAPASAPATELLRPRSCGGLGTSAARYARHYRRPFATIRAPR